MLNFSFDGLDVGNFEVVVIVVVFIFESFVFRVGIVEIELLVVLGVVVVVNLNDDFEFGVVEVFVVDGRLKDNLVLIGVVVVLFNLRLFLRENLLVVVVGVVVLRVGRVLGLLVDVVVVIVLKDSFDWVEDILNLSEIFIVGVIVVGVVVLFVFCVSFIGVLLFVISLFCWVFGVLNVKFEDWLKLNFVFVVIGFLKVRFLVNWEEVVVDVEFRERFFVVDVVVGVGLLNKKFDFEMKG